MSSNDLYTKIDSAVTVALARPRSMLATIDPLIEKLSELRAKKVPWCAIAEALGEAGVLTPKGVPFTALRLRQAYTLASRKRVGKDTGGRRGRNGNA